VKTSSTSRQTRDGHVLQRMGFARRITKATNTHSEHVTLIAFLLQQWLHERCLKKCQTVWRTQQPQAQRVKRAVAANNASLMALHKACLVLARTAATS
jgi:hypothetical protein